MASEAERCLQALELLQAIFPLPGELVLDEQSLAVAEQLRSSIDGSSPPSTALNITALVTLSIEGLEEKDAAQTLEVVIVLFALRREHSDKSFDWAIKCPAWLRREEHAGLVKNVKELQEADPEVASDPAGLLELVRSAASELLASRPPAPELAMASEEEEELVRAFYWFPSLSTRAKRDDLVNYAASPEWRLTGFVLAGKPGVLCCEGRMTAIDAYLSYIKTVSWRDIPPGHKKLSLRLVEPLSGPSARAFAEMSEITALIGKGGARANRGEMGELRAFLASKGLETAFGAVIGGGEFSS